MPELIRFSLFHLSPPSPSLQYIRPVCCVCIHTHTSIAVATPVRQTVWRLFPTVFFFFKLRGGKRKPVVSQAAKSGADNVQADIFLDKEKKKNENEIQKKYEDV